MYIYIYMQAHQRALQAWLGAEWKSLKAPPAPPRHSREGNPIVHKEIVQY